MKKIRLTKRQRMLLNELFGNDLSEEQILEKCVIGRDVFDGWLNEPAFLRALHGRIAAAYHQSSIMLARYAPTAAARLIELTESEKPETARRACLDIIEMGGEQEKIDEKQETMDDGRKTMDEGRGMTDDRKSAAFSHSQASKILAVLAEQK